MADYLQDLVDRAAIKDAVYRYCRGVDRLDTDLILSAYHPDGYDDHGDLKGDMTEVVQRLVPLLRSSYISTSHNICNQLIEIEGERALCESYFIAVHVTEDEHDQWQEIVFGRYVDRFERRGGDWRIAHRVVVIDSRNTRKVSASRLATDETRIPRGRRDASDAVYVQRSRLAAEQETAS